MIDIKQQVLDTLLMFVNIQMNPISMAAWKSGQNSSIKSEKTSGIF